MRKLQIYYQPVQTNPDHLESLTVSIYEFNETENTYKKKIVWEKDGSKYKIKEVLTDLDFVREKLSVLDIASYKSTDVNPGDAYYFVKHGDLSMATSNPNDIKDLLDWFGFDEIVKYDESRYVKCD